MKLNSYFKISLQFTTGVALGICGFLLPNLHPVIVENIFILRPISIVSYFWKTLRIEIVANYYFFNWTNSEDFYNVSVKPRFEEMGPYTFQHKEEKVNLTWNSNNTVTFLTKKLWFYKGKNNGLLDRVVSMNPIPLVVSYITRNWNYYYRKGFFMTFSSLPLFTSNLIMTQTIGSLLFDGYPEPWIKVGATLPFLAQYNFPLWDKYGYFYKRNDTTDFNGILNMGTGINSQMGEIYYWNYQNKTPYYDNVCGAVKGSGQQLFSRNLKKDNLPLFLAEFGRPLNLTFQKEETVNNILGYKFVISEKVLDNGSIYQENRCSCNGECVPSGTFNATSFTHSLPAFTSLPHFYKADPYYINLVDGLKPDANRHDFYMVVEPTTGIPIKAHMTMQLNLLVQPIPGVLLFENAPRFFLPVWWTEYSYEMQGLLLFLLKFVLSLPLILKSIGICMIVVSISVTAITIIKGIIQLQQNHKNFDFFEEQHIPINLYFQETI